jgi:ribosomal-protein-alanine N-acetyltransferase
MCRKDLEQVLAIEEASFPSPWSWKSFETELRKDFSVSIVADVDDRVVGYLIGWFIADEIHIANIAVHPEWRKRGIGELLIHEIVKMGRGHSWIGLEVRRSNRAARSLYSKLCFREVGVRKNYYAQEGEDAILMVRRIHS